MSRCVPVVVVCLSVVLGGCASAPLIPPGSACEVSVPQAQFYKYGPAQSFGADQSLPMGTRLTMLERDFGFSRVQLDNGIAGYIATDELRPVSPEPSAAPGERGTTTRKHDRVFTGPVKRSNVKPTPGEPLFDINDVPLPMSDNPPKPEPAKPAPGQH